MVKDTILKGAGVLTRMNSPFFITHVVLFFSDIVHGPLSLKTPASFRMTYPQDVVAKHGKVSESNRA